MSMKKRAKRLRIRANNICFLQNKFKPTLKTFADMLGKMSKMQRVAGQASVIEVFLPCLDTFKEAKKMISDEKILEGVEMIEEKIVQAP